MLANFLIKQSEKNNLNEFSLILELFFSNKNLIKYFIQLFEYIIETKLKLNNLTENFDEFFKNFPPTEIM